MLSGGSGGHGAAAEETEVATSITNNNTANEDGETVFKMMVADDVGTVPHH
jgi:hypothetical protein